MKKIVILGGGISGYGSAVLAKKEGFEVFLSDSGTIAEAHRARLDEWGVEYEQGGHTAERILAADEVIKSPGIPDTAPVVRALIEKGVPIISEIEFAGRYMGDARTICITGSNGKTTTTTLTYNILRDAGFDVGLGGNIGESFAWQVATAPREWYVLELSSFQLDGMHDFRADIAVLLNITPDHLDRYDHRLELYAASKMRITRNQRAGDFFVYCADDPQTVKMLDGVRLPMRTLPFTVKHIPTQGARLEGGLIRAKVGTRTLRLDPGKMRLRGTHNIYNTMAASLAALAAGVKPADIAATVERFEGIEHRLQSLGEHGGVEWINDSKATNVDAVWYALESMARPVVWIAGGTDKGNDYTRLYPFAPRIRALVCMGVDNSGLEKAFAGRIPVIRSTGSLDEAMKTARELAAPGDTVLLSPACASFDLFDNYEHRGRLFRLWVEKELKIKN
jgi:UDP-N-acetylmuramoylalanine--D-glutamate ligase